MTSETESRSVAEVAPPVGSLPKAAFAVGAATAVSGLALVAVPRLALRALGAGRAEPSPFLFRIIGMFMTVSGGLLADGS
ncbi:MAG: hypothetical protein ACRDZZ_06645, partial [Ilumatobacteraceae bacterium]